mmetsp:Transcript_31341/g.66327  ORF Transcript_31341/g.66327 Transcript_31341/m.66327 type:complete len:267 (+) Transcript_31341:366-1166(+)
MRRSRRPRPAVRPRGRDRLRRDTTTMASPPPPRYHRCRLPLLPTRRRRPRLFGNASDPALLWMRRRIPPPMRLLLRQQLPRQWQKRASPSNEADTPSSTLPLGNATSPRRDTGVGSWNRWNCPFCYDSPQLWRMLPMMRLMSHPQWMPLPLPMPPHSSGDDDSRPARPAIRDTTSSDPIVVAMPRPHSAAMPIRPRREDAATAAAGRSWIGTRRRGGRRRWMGRWSWRFWGGVWRRRRRVCRLPTWRRRRIWCWWCHCCRKSFSFW